MATTKSSPKSVEDLQSANNDVIARLADKRDLIQQLRYASQEDVQRVEAELHARQLAEEEARVDAELSMLKAQAGIKHIRDSAPELSSEADARLASEAEAEAKAAAKSATEEK